MQSKSVIIALALILVPLLSSAEFYKYRDESGVLRYTDDISKIPEDQRPRIDTYNETDDFLTPEQKQLKIENAKKAREASQAAKNAKNKSAARLKLSQTKTALDQEYKKLMQIKQDLVNSQAEAMENAADAKAHGEKVIQLNQRIADFENRRQAFLKQADAFHALPAK